MMKSYLFILLGALLLSPPSIEKSDSKLANLAESAREWPWVSQDTSAAANMPFIAIYTLGPAWQSGKPAHEQAYFKEHSANLQKLRAEKKILLGARYSDKGMIILSATDEKEARARLESDPMVANKVFNLELYPFHPFYKGCLP
jgi:uncharacterized protein YciI